MLYVCVTYVRGDDGYLLHVVSQLLRKRQGLKQQQDLTERLLDTRKDRVRMRYVRRLDR